MSEITTLEQAGKYLMEKQIVNFENMTVEGKQLLDVCGFSYTDKNWGSVIDRQIIKHNFLENKDFYYSHINVGKGRPKKVMNFTINAANHVLLAAMTNNGKAARQEAIDDKMNKVAEPQFQLPQNYIEALEYLVVAEKEKEKLQLVNKEQEQTLIEQAPKVEFADAVSDAKIGISFKECSKALGLGRNTMMSILRDEKILQKNNTPYQTFIDRGYFQVKQGTSHYGHITHTTIVTGKGEIWLHKYLTKNGHL
jgi:phage antirepressor YoqD-like protein